MSVLLTTLIQAGLQSGYSGYSGGSGYSGAGVSGYSGYSGAGSAITVYDEGNVLTSSLTSMNFTGTAVTATNTGGAVTVNITGGSADQASVLKLVSLRL